MQTIGILIGILLIGIAIVLLKEFKNAPYYDEVNNRFVPKSEEKEWLKQFEDNVLDTIEKEKENIEETITEIGKNVKD